MNKARFITCLLRGNCMGCMGLSEVATNKKCLKCNNYKICKKMNDKQDSLSLIELSDEAQISLNMFMFA